MAFKDLIKRWKTYAHMSSLGEIARRKFFNNCFDGVLTCAGIISGFFIVFLDGIVNRTQTLLLTGLATALAIGISGIWGAFLSEEAERTKKLKELSQAMGKSEYSSVEADIRTEKESLSEISRAMGVPETFLLKSKYHGKVKQYQTQLRRNSPKKPTKTITERAEHFATIVASIVDGVAPVMGSLVPLIPFFFGSVLTIWHFGSAYIILISMLILLGIFLGKIAGKSTIKYVLHLVLAGIVTLLISLLLGV
ncbi:MAG: hypothetical protein RBG13Loki_1758 [Promethearchaeota archaeon CR_4]|nr:MAG: hypothetical protein RBG13Loki_1758 [Candidatus Lokiarchaeota archaeon CR_4]